MRAPNSQRSLNAPSSSFVITSSFILLTIFLVAIPVSTRSVTSARHHEIRHSADGIINEKFNSESLVVADGSAPADDKVSSSQGESRLHQKEEKIVKDSHSASDDFPVISGFGQSKSDKGNLKEEHEGIRRFDAVVASDGTLGKTSASKTEKSQNRRNANAQEIGKTVSKGIFVRDEPVEEETGISHSKVIRKRSLNGAGAAGIGGESVKKNSEKAHLDSSPGRVQLDISSHNVRDESSADSIKSRQVPVLIPVGSSHAKPHHNLAKHSEKPIAAESRKHDVHSPAIEGSSDRVAIEKGKSEIDDKVRKIPELTEAHERSVGEIAKSAIVIPEPKKIVINSDGLGDVAESSAESPEQVENARKSLPIADDEHDENDAENDQSQLKIENGKKSQEEKLKPLKNQDSLDYDSSSLTNIMKTNVSLEGLKLQALSLQKDIRNKTLLQRLKDQAIQVLPGIPKFSENELLEALHEIEPPKKIAEGEYSYISKLDTSMLSERQLKILKCAEALVVREQRQTFGENVIECIRGLNILNCMRIFVWPIIADNLPQILGQNLPTLPIEVNVMDWLPGNQQDKPKSTRLRSTTGSHQQQQLVTPELVVSGILRDALSANPMNDDIPTFIDPHNETLSKLLTPGQLEILKMAEKFLPESARKEYSDYMYSCVRTFEYFSCVKYFAWPMVQRYFSTLPDFPNYPSWYPSMSDLPAIGSPVLSIVNSGGIGELPEIIEADDPKRTRSPRPEAVIVNILENTLRQSPNQPIGYQARHPEAIPAPTVTADQMAIFYLAEQLIPVPMRAEFMSKTMQCIRDYDYLSCTKYATWPTVRQFIPGLPSFPDFSSWIPTFAVPDFSQYIPDIGSYFPGFPGFPGSSGTTPAPASETEQVNATATVTNSTTLLKEENRQAEALHSIENQIIDILHNIRWIVLTRNSQPAASTVPGNFAILNTLTYNQRQILGLATSIVPQQLRGDLDARFVGCLQGGSDFLICTKNIIWPTLELYVKDLPVFPEREIEPAAQIGSEPINSSGLEGFGALKPGIYQPIVDSHGPVGLTGLPTISHPFEGRSPIGSQIAAEPEEAPISVSQILAETQPSEGLQQGQESIDSPDKKSSAKSSDASAPVISVTDTRFTPIFSDNPESVILKILTTVQTSSKFADTSYTLVTSEYLESLKAYLNADQKSIIQVSERLLPEAAKLKFTEGMSGCVKSWNFSVCSREIVWPTLSHYYPQLPSFPDFNIDETRTDPASPASTKSIVTGDGAAAAAISETDVKTGQHGDAVVTITDTRFVPIYSQHPEEVILGILKNVQSSSPNFLIQQSSAKPVTRSSEFVASFTDQQGNIITISENLLPEQIREVFTKKMTECVKENSFMACTRDIAWPTIAQFFPRLPNFPNIGALPEVAIEEPQQPTLLPPQLESGTRHAVLAKSPIIAEAASIALPTPNYLPFVPEDVESRIESILKQIFSTGLYTQTKTSYLNAKDPLTAPFLTERQSNVIRMTENMLPSAMKPLFVGLMIDCSRENVFPICVRNVGWPMLRQFVPNVPSFPDLNNFGTYFPQVPQEIPQFPQGQLPQLPNFPGFGFPGSGYGYPFRAAQDKLDHSVPAYVGESSLIAGGQQAGGVYLQGIQGIQGITPSVDTQRTGYGGGSSSRPFVVSRRASEPADLLSGAVASTGNRRRRERRSLPTVPTESRRDESLDNADLARLNVTESEFLQILINITKQSNEETRGPEVYFVDKLNSTVKEALSADQFAILKIVEDLSHRTTKAGFMSKVIQCITSLSFIRCMGIFVWPLITQNLPSLLGNLNPFGRSHEDNSSFVDIFGMTQKEFERELLLRKENAEGILIDWYRGVVEERFDNDYGYVRIQGYGDGEIGISFNGFSRTGRIAKIKDHKNLPSILTIISDIMEDMLDQRESKLDNDRKKDQKTRENGKRDRSLRRGFLGDYNKLINESENSTDSERSSNDDEIISMFLDKIKSNGSNDNDANGEAHHYLSVENAYEAFELLFGTRLSERMAERLNDLGKSHFRLFDDKNSEEFPSKNPGTLVDDSAESTTRSDSDSTGQTYKEEKKNDQDLENKKATGKKKNHSGLVLRLPKIDEEFMSRKITGSLENLGRKMKMQMSQILPGVTFVFSFFIQMALAHARAAASIAGMMSNMALGSAMLDMLRQNFFGPSTEPKIKYVYDNEMVGPGITWPLHNHHG